MLYEVITRPRRTWRQLLCGIYAEHLPAKLYRRTQHLLRLVLLPRRTRIRQRANDRGLHADHPLRAAEPLPAIPDLDLRHRDDRGDPAPAQRFV